MVKAGTKRAEGGKLKAVAGDRGFYSRANEDWLKDSGGRQVSIPKRGKNGIFQEELASTRGLRKTLSFYRSILEAEITPNSNCNLTR